MWRQLAVVVTLATACVPVAESESSAHTRQPLPGVDIGLVLGPVVKGGAANAHLGTSLDVCRFGTSSTGGWVAGAPGIDSLYVSSSGTFFKPVNVDAASVIGTSVLCDRSSGLAWVGGSDGLYRVHADGGFDLVFDDGEVSSLAGAFDAPPLFSSPVFGGGVDLHSVLAATGVAGVQTVLHSNSPQFGTSIAYAPGGERFVVGDPGLASATVYTLEADGGATTVRAISDGDVMGEYGRAVLMADITDDVGPELIVAAPGGGRVSVYSASRLRYEILAPAVGGTQPVEFGAALAVEPSIGNRGVAALWIGEPGNDRVFRCIGTECVMFTAPGITGHFGQTLAFDGRKLLVGAPDYSGSQPMEGAVFTFALDAGALEGEAQDCTASAACTTRSCGLGRCIGGVFCFDMNQPACDSGQACENGQSVLVDDAGVDGGVGGDGGVDAGVDGGPNVDDGGVPVDDGGGTPEPEDASMVNYRAGCGAAPGAGCAILAMLGWARRRLRPLKRSRN
ncbi:MAG: hypothetical protein ACO1OB_04905 [Archangium sp.]